MKYLPNPSSQDLIWILDPGPFPLTEADFFWPRFRWLRYMFCPHASVVEFQRIDTRTGPGALADKYEGTCCSLCGRIIHERKM